MPNRYLVTIEKTDGTKDVICVFATNEADVRKDVEKSTFVKKVLSIKDADKPEPRINEVKLDKKEV